MSIRYTSTRGEAPELDFADVVLTGLAPDGGLYCPVDIPSLPDLTTSDGSYADIARRVMWPFVEGTLAADDFNTMVTDAYAGFRHPDVCPVVDLGDNQFLLDLTRGPTLAFKDVALQLVGRLLDHELSRRGERVVVISATSGDTGSAAIEALANRNNLHAVVLHPHERVSDVQRRQMTTVTAPNIHNLAIEGTFDDCQDLVKAAFLDHSITAGHQPAAVNSINWARVMAQIVYYVTSARVVAPDGGPVSYSVPTGNFGNVFAGWGARSMGLPIDKFCVASNSNDILARLFNTGTMQIEEVVPTLSPSMDIQVSSNLERLLYEILGNDGPALRRLMQGFRDEQRMTLPAELIPRMQEAWVGESLDDDQTVSVIRRVYEESGIILDPHTAVGVGAAQRRPDSLHRMVMATAHPAKFPDAVERATGVRPALPYHLADLFEREEKYVVMANDVATVQSFVEGIRAP